ncbi:methyltransferase (TIGR00027 family) [Nocardia transvalensis]|uniref:S-adenosyl-L-methionine-dependent methyltransferase n=1 Tax=Nocardia transvalensis TaxID=37333 RepID=A0A7W9PLF2_9NOCA|nr:class I SAM-dependent methyltransferase [Nocardia transvalensis]MBB5918246.1 methyltransferase (TIGR00027 family) [Nocardia transvalensis]
MRTDGDTWDIVSSVGATALGVATLRAMETTLPDAMIRDDYAHLFVHAAGDPQFIETAGDPEAAGSLPRIIGFRTRFFDEFFDAATASGIEQAVIVASGLDARAYRLDWAAGATVFEIDQPKVLEFKQQVLGEHGVTPKATLRQVPVDLRDDWPAALIDAGFDPARPTAWSAEGLLPYLPGAAQDSLFERIHALSAPGSRVAVEYFTERPDTARFQAVARSSQFDKSPFGHLDVAELFYVDDRTDPARWLADQGWSVGSDSVANLAERYDRPMPELPEEARDLSEAPAYLTAQK